jgi:hypothetical protein
VALKTKHSLGSKAMATTLQTNRLAGLEYPPDFLTESPTGPSVSWNAMPEIHLENPFHQKLIETQHSLVIDTGANPGDLRLPRFPILTSATTVFLFWESGTRVENSRLGALLEYACRLAQPRKTRAAISTIKFNLSLNLSQLADVLRVRRPTVYTWLNEDTDVRIQPDHQRRIEQLASYADLWWTKAARQLPKELLNSSLGSLLLDQLGAEVLNDQLIRRIIEAVCNELPAKRRFVKVKGVGPLPEDESLTLDEFMD